MNALVSCFLGSYTAMFRAVPRRRPSRATVRGQGRFTHEEARPHARRSLRHGPRRFRCRNSGHVNIDRRPNLATAESNVVTLLHQYKPTAAWEASFKTAEAIQSADIAKVNSDLSPAPAPVSSGHTLTQQEQSAVAAAKQYLSISAFSRLGLIAQLDSPDGGGYPVNVATVAVDSLTVNWDTEAVEAAKAYLAIVAVFLQRP